LEIVAAKSSIRLDIVMNPLDVGIEFVYCQTLLHNVAGSATGHAVSLDIT
jgi:hypothetical protein